MSTSLKGRTNGIRGPFLLREYVLLIKVWFNSLRTRIAYVQGAEKNLEEKRQHCELPEHEILGVVPLIFRNRHQSRQGI